MSDYKVGKYSKERMVNLANKDRYINFVYMDLMKRYNEDEDQILKEIYHSEVKDGKESMKKSYDA